MLDPSQYELEERNHMVDVLLFGSGAVVVAIGIVLMISVAFMALGLVVFAIGMMWLFVAAFLHHTGSEDIHPQPVRRHMGNLEDNSVH